MSLPFHGAEQEDAIRRWHSPDGRFRGPLLDVSSGNPVLIHTSYHCEPNG